MSEALYLSIDERVCFVERHGSGANPIVCVHTAGQSGVQFRGAISSFVDRGYSPVIVDMPGHGRSEPAQDGPITDLGRYAEWCLDVITRLELERPFLLGCSIGGKIVLDMATRAPEDLAGVVAMACYAGLGGRKHLARAWALEDSSSPSMRDRSYYGHAALCGSRVSPERRDMIALMHSREDWNITLCDQAAWSAHDVSSLLSGISCPVIVAVGEDDFSVPLHRVEESVRQIPAAHGLVISGIGHYPMEEIPSFGHVFDGWIRGVDLGGESLEGSILRRWDPPLEEA